MTHTGYKTPLLYFFTAAILYLSAQEQKGEIIMGIQAQKFTKEEEEVQKSITKLFNVISINDVAVIKSYRTNDGKFYEYGQITDMATFEEGLKFSEGVEYVLVNGVLVLKKGKKSGWRISRTGSICKV